METKEKLNAYLDRLYEDYDAIIAKHGYGVRPSYVSTDLAYLSMRIERAKEKLMLIGLESPCDEWHGSYGKGQI